MARKKSVPAQNELLLPSLALSALVLILVGVLVTGMGPNNSTNSQVSANKSRLLTKGTQVDDLEADLLLLQEDTLDAEISVLEQTQ